MLNLPASKNIESNKTVRLACQLVRLHSESQIVVQLFMHYSIFEATLQPIETCQTVSNILDSRVRDLPRPPELSVICEGLRAEAA